MRAVVLVMIFSGAACHLADSPEPPKCPAGSHPNLGNCVADEVGADETVTIASGCALTPESLTVPFGKAFSFKNDDGVDHEIHGADGQLWTTAKAGAFADPQVNLAKAGSWKYTVSGCTGGGTIVVE